MALTANRELNRYVDQELRSFPVAASEHVWKGAFVGIDRGTGHVRNLQSGDQFAGIAYEEADNTGGAGGARLIRLYTQGDFVLETGGAIQPLVGISVHALDDEVAILGPFAGASYIGVIMSVITSNQSVVRILPVGSQQVEHAVQVPLTSLTSGAVTHPVLIPQRAIRVISAEVSFLTVPDQGNLDVGTTVADPDELVNAFNLATLVSNTPTSLILLNRDIAAGMNLWAKVGQATTTAGDGGLLSIRYIELP